MEQNLKTINIKGKAYVEVNERIAYFRSAEEFVGWSMESEIIQLSEDSCVIKASIKNVEGRVIATGFAQEDKSSSLVNSTSFVENCETSAWGRALGNLGIGIKSSVASADEVHMAIEKQQRFVNSENVPTQPVQNQENEIRLFQIQGNDGQLYDVEYKKCYSKKNQQYFWGLVNQEDANFFPRYQKYEG